MLFEVRRGIEPLYRELPVIQDLPSESNRPCIQPDHKKKIHIHQDWDCRMSPNPHTPLSLTPLNKLYSRYLMRITFLFTVKFMTYLTQQT